MDEYHRLIALFAYETDGGRNSFLWKNPWYFSHPGGQGGKELDEAYAAWQRTKRGFKAEEITKGVWYKVGDNGLTFKVTFHPGGKLTEEDDSGSWEGSWELIGVVLRMRVGKYELDIVANKIGDVHSGVEVADGKLNAYYKVGHKY